MKIPQHIAIILDGNGRWAKKRGLPRNMGHVEGSKNVTIVIVHKDGSQKELQFTTDLEYLADLLLEKELATGYTSEEYGFTVESVDGVVADWAADSAYWALYEGEEYATTSAAGIVLTDGGVYKLVYETF